MNHRIIERKKIGKGKYSVTTYKGYADYFFTNGIAYFILGCCVLPFMLFFWFYKYLILAIIWGFKKIKEIYTNKKTDKEI